MLIDLYDEVGFEGRGCLVFGVVLGRIDFVGVTCGYVVFRARFFEGFVCRR